MSASAYMTDVNSNYRASTSNRSDGDGSKGFGFRIQDHWKSGYYVGHKWSGLCTYDRWFGNYNGVATAYYIHTYDSASLESVDFGFDGKTAGISATITNSVKSLPLLVPINLSVFIRKIKGYYQLGSSLLFYPLT